MKATYFVVKVQVLLVDYFLSKGVIKVSAMLLHGHNLNQNVQLWLDTCVHACILVVFNLLTGSSGGPNPTMKLNTSNTAIVAIPVIVVILAVVVGTIIIVLVVVGLLYKKHQRSSYNPRSSSSSLSDGTMDSYNMLDLTKNHNGGTMIEMKERDEATANFADPLDVPFDPSGDVTIENFKDHVEKCDAKRQLLFQEEFEVRM